MMRLLMVVAALSLCTGGVRAQAPKADCSTYRKLSDGRWTSTITARIGNPKEFITVEPGIAIDRNTMVVGINVSDTLDRLCGGK